MTHTVTQASSAVERPTACQQAQHAVLMAHTLTLVGSAARITDRAQMAILALRVINVHLEAVGEAALVRQEV